MSQINRNTDDHIKGIQLEKESRQSNQKQSSSKSGQEKDLNLLDDIEAQMNQIMD